MTDWVLYSLLGICPPLDQPKGSGGVPLCPANPRPPLCAQLMVYRNVAIVWRLLAARKRIFQADPDMHTYDEELDA